MAVPTHPKWGITLSTLFIVIYFFLQFTRPLSSSFREMEGEIYRYQYVPNKKNNDSTLFIWLNDTISKPYMLSYRSGQDKIKSKLDALPMVKIWFDLNREIKALKINDKKIITYQWFVWLYTFFLIVGLIFHLAIYWAIRKESVNINSYLKFWQYFFGEIPLIMKRTNKPFDPNESIW